jgi:hypothetical protein
MGYTANMETDTTVIPEQETPELIQDRASIAVECEQCETKSCYKTQKIGEGEDIPLPARMLLTAEPDCVLIRESRIDGLEYAFFKCNDQMCLIRRLREGMSLYWLQEQHRKFILSKQRKGHRSKKNKKRR